MTQIIRCPCHVGGTLRNADFAQYQRECRSKRFLGIWLFRIKGPWCFWRRERGIWKPTAVGQALAEHELEYVNAFKRAAHLMTTYIRLGSLVLTEDQPVKFRGFISVKIKDGDDE